MLPPWRRHSHISRHPCRGAVLFAAGTRVPHNAGVSGHYPPPPPNQPPNQPPQQSGQPGQPPNQPGQPPWGAAPPPTYQPTQGYPPQYPGYGGGPTGPTGPTGPGGPGGPTGPYQGYPPSGDGNGGGGNGLLITTIVVGAVAVIAAITTMIIVLTHGDDEPTAGGGSETSQTDEPTTAETPDDPTTSEPPDDPTPTADPPPDGAVPVGTAATVGDWSIEVTGFDDDADAEIKAANQFNEPPSTGRYVIATISATYQGRGEGNVSFGLHMTFTGPNGDEHEDYDCGAVEPRSSISAPPLRRGDSHVFDTCFDVPVASIENATMKVNQDFDDATEVTFDL